MERKLQIARRTSAALQAIPDHASIYDNSRPAHWARRRRVPISLRSHPMLADEGNPFGLGDETVVPNGSNLRDELFQNALEELEDGEFGAHWNSTSLNEVYAGWGHSRDPFPPIPILHDVNMGSLAPEAEQDGPSGILDSVSISSSSVASDRETYMAQSAEPVSRLQARLGSSASTLATRQNLSRVPLLRRSSSIRRSRYGRPSSSIELEATRRRLARTYGEEYDAAMWTPADDPSLGSEWTRHLSQATGTRTPNIFRGDEPAGAAFRRRWNNLDPEPLASGSNDTVATTSGRRNLRRGGLRAPEALIPRSRIALASPSIMTTPSSPVPARPDNASTQPVSAADVVLALASEELHQPAWDQMRPSPVGSSHLPARWESDALPIYATWGMHVPETSTSHLPPLASTSGSGVIPTPPAEPDTAEAAED